MICINTRKEVKAGNKDGDDAQKAIWAVYPVEKKEDFKPDKMSAVATFENETDAKEYIASRKPELAKK